MHWLCNSGKSLGIDKNTHGIHKPDGCVINEFSIICIFNYMQTKLWREMCIGEHCCCMWAHQIVWVPVALSLQTKVDPWPLTSMIELVLTNEHSAISTTSFWEPKVNTDGRVKQRQRQRQSIALSQLKSVFIWAVISIDLSFRLQTALKGSVTNWNYLQTYVCQPAPGNHVVFQGCF